MSSNNNGLPPGYRIVRDKTGRVAFINQNAPVPKGWRISSVNGRPFFINDDLKTTQWEDPRMDYNDPRPIPWPWEKRVNSDGRVFYANSVNHTTQWNDPRPTINTTDTPRGKTISSDPNTPTLTQP